MLCKESEVPYFLNLIITTKLILKYVLKEMADLACENITKEIQNCIATNITCYYIYVVVVICRLPKCAGRL